jgi:hypothetical protein
MVIVAAIAILMTAATYRQDTRAVVAAPAFYEASFRDLPASVRTGDILTVQLNVSSGSTCDGSITYRDGAVQKLDSMQESGGRCRWDKTVPTDARRGTADIVATAHKGSEQATLQASIEVIRRADDLDASFNDLPGIAKRNETVSIRVDVSDGATCVGGILYDDGRSQSLDQQSERKNRCKWDITVPSDMVIGPAQVRVTISLGSTQTSLAGSFDVGRQSDGNHFAIGYRELPTSVRRDDSFLIRLQVPDDATCTGTVAYYGVAPQTLSEVKPTDGECRWTGRVPTDAKAGNAEIQTTVKSGSDQETAMARVPVDRGSSTDVGASFKDLPESIQRKQTLEIRVNVPDDATCDGSFTYYDSDAIALSTQSERKNRCLWQIDVPSNAVRGTATVRVTVHDGPDSSTLVGNVEVLAKDEVSKASWSDDLPGSAKPGDTFDIKVNAPNDSICSGKISYADGMKWQLGKRDEDKAICKWTVTVPISTGAGPATVDISVMKGANEVKLNGTFNVEAIVASP